MMEEKFDFSKAEDQKEFEGLPSEEKKEIIEEAHLEAEEINKSRDEKISEKEKLPEKEKIIDHFKTELLKIKDIKQNTGRQKAFKINTCLELINHWLPFGNLDNFEGIQEGLSVIKEINHDNKMILQAGEDIVNEMAFQFREWNEDESVKIKIIRDFINFAMGGKKPEKQKIKGPSEIAPGQIQIEKKEETKTNIRKDSPIKLNITYEDIERIKKEMKEAKKAKADKEQIWIIKETKTLLSYIFDDKRDKTLSSVSQILAMAGVNYKKFQPLITDEIESQNTHNTTLKTVFNIEEKTKEERLNLFIQEKMKKGALPALPLKIEFYEKQIIEKLTKEGLDPEEIATLLAVIEEYGKCAKDEKSAERMKKLKEKIETIIKKEKEEETPEAVIQAKEFIKGKEEKDKKEPIWKGVTGGMIGFSLLLFLILFLLGEIKLTEKLSGLDIISKK